jgi:aldehyde dehydrogenase (NAD+)
MAFHTETTAPNDTANIADTVAAVRAGFDSGLTRPVSWRLDQLRGLSAMLRTESDRFEAALASDLGKPSIEGYAADIATVASEIDDIAKHLPKWMKPRRVKVPLTVQPGRAYVLPQPLGVTLIIAPWNYPVQLLLLPAAVSIAAGNACVLKPSEVAPATSALLAELLPRFTDSKAIATVEGGVDTSTELLEQRFDYIFYTGSTAVGRIVHQAASRHLTPCTLELGGKSPVLVDDSANLEVAARRIAWGKWLNAGQTCVAPDYVLISATHRDRFVELLERSFAEFADGTDTRTNPDFTSIVNERHTERLRGLLANHNGTVAFGGDSDVADRWVEPTIIIDPDPDSPVMQEEIFGPILPIITVDSLADAISFVTDRPHPLALYVFAEHDDTIEHVIDHTSAGGTCINHVIQHLLPSDLPFGGVGESGFGRYHGRAGFDTFSNLRAVLKKPTRIDPKLVYPPYTEKKSKLIRRFL